MFYIFEQVCFRNVFYTMISIQTDHSNSYFPWFGIFKTIEGNNIIQQ